MQNSNNNTVNTDAAKRWWDALNGETKKRMVFSYYGSYNVSNLLDKEIADMYKYNSEHPTSTVDLKK